MSATAIENGWRPPGVEDASTSIATCDASRTPKGSTEIDGSFSVLTDGSSNPRLERAGAVNGHLTIAEILRLEKKSAILLAIRRRSASVISSF
jgi:hypothetical protein